MMAWISRTLVATFMRVSIKIGVGILRRAEPGEQG
jgi:hypothetical protein